MEYDEEIQEYLILSLKYLHAARLNLDNDLIEPALFNGIHALELGIKALLSDKVDGPLNTHNVGGLLGKHYRETIGEEKCRQMNRILIRYNIPRYPMTDPMGRDEVSSTIDVIEDFLEGDVRSLLS